MTRPPPLSTFLFDLDGTLIDSIELILASYRHTMRVHRGAAPPDSHWLAGIGTPLTQQLAGLSNDPAEIDAMLRTYREHNLAWHDRMVRPYPGVREAVAALAARGARLGVVTSKKRDGALRGLRLCGMEEYFPVLVCADDVQRHKPDPTPVLRALELLGSNAQDSVFIGDSPHDLHAGRAAGVRTGAVEWGPFDRADLRACRPNYWIAEPDEIAELS
jgi:pyrophosphatase PpaX